MSPMTGAHCGFLRRASTHLNFFRLHVLVFTVVPLLASLVFYWCNDARADNEAFVSFTDSLFLCVSAATVAGLFPVVLSNLQVGQQIILAILTAVGSYSFVSLLMVVIRRHYFSKEMRKQLARRQAELLQPSLLACDAELRDASHGPTNSPDPKQEQQVQATESSAPPTPRPSNETRSVEFAGSGIRLPEQSLAHLRRRTTEVTHSAHARPQPRSGVSMTRTETLPTRKDRGLGGFPSVSVALRKGADYILNRQPSRFSRKRTEMQRTTTLQSVRNATIMPNPQAKVVSYLTFDAIVGKNSNFQGLTEEEREELGGVELRALNILAWIVPAYWFGVQLLGFTILAPYMARAQFRSGLTTEDGQAAPINSTWFSLFQVISSYANNGILVDASLVPFQTAYLLLLTMIALILAGNTAFPCFLRFFIWLGSKCVSKKTQAYATLRFILDHPRRCFLYLFPSLQTWYLFGVIICLNVVDWILFLLLDIGNGPISSIPTGVRVMAGLFQAVAVRCGGFQIVSLGSLAPAVQVLYVVMMYVGALPITLGVRSTNVYEDRSIALFEEELDEDEPDASVFIRPGVTGAKVWGEYTAWHLKRQLSFDLWWLAIAVFLICILERGKMLDPEKSSYINVFSIIFEVVSGYGTVGLSLGVSGQNFSLSGALGTCSKLILCAVMLRGRHRGLPDAIDRSVLLPGELGRQAEMELEFRERQEAMREALTLTRERTDASRIAGGKISRNIKDERTGVA